MLTTRFKVDYTKDVCKCHKCLQAIPKHGIRFAIQAAHNPYINNYYHVKCLFKQFQLVKITTGLIESTKDIDNFNNIDDYDQKYISGLISSINIPSRLSYLQTSIFLIYRFK
jgi:hypothetical protein